MLDTVTISQTYVDEIMSIAGFPLLTTIDNDFEMTSDQIKTLVIIPTLREYYRWFPITTLGEYGIGGQFAIDFPSTETFNIVQANINTVGQFSTIVASNAFIRSRYYSKTSEYGPGMYGTRNSYGMENSVILKEGLNQSYVDRYKSFRVYVDEVARQLKGYSNTSGKLSVTWASYNSDFSKIPFTRINDVIKLAQSKLLTQLVMIRGQMNSGIENEFNISLFQDKATELSEEVIGNWKKMSKVVIQRG